MSINKFRADLGFGKKLISKTVLAIMALLLQVEHLSDMHHSGLLPLMERGDTTMWNGEANLAEVSYFNVIPNQRYRFRLIGTQPIYALQFSTQVNSYIVRWFQNQQHS